MEFWAEKLAGALHPADDESWNEFAKVPTGKPLHVEVKQPRNGAHHRLFWALCARIGEARGVPSETVSDVLKIATGHCTIVRSKSYGELRLPKSISFAAMDQTTFREFFERCVVVIYEEWKIEPELVADLLLPPETGILMR